MVEILRKAIEWKDLLESGQIATQADIACQEGISRARVIQVMGTMIYVNVAKPNTKEHSSSDNHAMFRAVCEKLQKHIGSATVHSHTQSPKPVLFF